MVKLEALAELEKLAELEETEGGPKITEYYRLRGQFSRAGRSNSLRVLGKGATRYGIFKTGRSNFLSTLGRGPKI